MKRSKKYIYGKTNLSYPQMYISTYSILQMSRYGVSCIILQLASTAIKPQFFFAFASHISVNELHVFFLVYIYSTLSPNSADFVYPITLGDPQLGHPAIHSNSNTHKLLNLLSPWKWLTTAPSISHFLYENLYINLTFPLSVVSSWTVITDCQNSLSNWIISFSCLPPWFKLSSHQI